MYEEAKKLLEVASVIFQKLSPADKLRLHGELSLHFGVEPEVGELEMLMVEALVALNYETPSLSFFKPNQSNLANGEFFV